MFKFRGENDPSLFFFFCVLLFAGTTPAMAGWTAGARAAYGRLEKKFDHRPNGELDAIYGSAGVKIGAILRAARFGHLHYTNSTDFLEGGAPFEALIFRTGRKKSPLVFFFPGVFADPNGAAEMMVGRQIRRGRNHVVILPNPLSKSFQSTHPNFFPGDFEREAETMADFIEYAISEIGPDRISEIRFAGESYGGFLAPVTARELNRRGKYHVQSVVSVSVPYQFGNAVDVLDAQADATEAAYFDQGCEVSFRHLFEMVGFAFELILNPGSSELFTKGGVACSAAIFSNIGFQQPLFALAKSLDARHPSAEWAEHPESYWRRNIRFHEFGPLFYGTKTTEMLGKDSASLAGWVNPLRAEGTETLALVAKDDPLNPPSGEYPVVAPYLTGEVLSLTHGGHLGFRGSKEYRRLLRKQFKSSSSGEVSSADVSEAAPDDSLDNDVAAANDDYSATDADDEDTE